MSEALNTRPAPAWLDDVLHSGRVSRIAQHIALVIWHHWDARTGECRLSARDLARLTGWHRNAVLTHMAELRDYLIVEWVGGRGKARIELAGVALPPLEDDDLLEGVNGHDVAALRLATGTQPAAEPPSPPELVAHQKDTSSVVAHQEDTNVVAHHRDTTELVAHYRDTSQLVAHQKDTTACGSPEGHKPVVAHHRDTNASPVPAADEAPFPPSPPYPLSPLTPHLDSCSTSENPPLLTMFGKGVVGENLWSTRLTYSIEPEAEPMLFAEMESQKTAKPILPTSRIVDKAIDAYNEAATRHGWTRCTARTPARTARCAKRLTDIGGLEAWKLALLGVPQDEFLSGKVIGRDGREPFRLTLDRLMQTDGNLGDVLARMIDLGMRASAMPAASDTPAGAEAPVNGKVWGWWREGDMLLKLRAIPEEGWRKMLAKTPPNGTWPWWALAAPPGHAECALPASLSAEYEAKYGGTIRAVETSR